MSHPVTALNGYYPRLVAALPAESRGRSNDNAAGYAASVDPRRAPVRVEISDLVAEIEDTAKTICWHVCAALDLATYQPNQPGRHEGVDAATVAALATLGQHWPVLERMSPAMAEAAEERLATLGRKARRMLGESLAAPVPLVIGCPECGLPTMFRVETEQGVIATCSACGSRWDEIEWEARGREVRTTVGG